VILAYLIPIILAYLLGSLTFSIWTGKLFFHVDVREHGSGNAGATNTWRVLGWKAGLPVLLLDIGKGFASTRLPLLFINPGTEPTTLLWLQIICGVFAAIGHIYPVFAGFRGGKGVSTLLGIVLGLMPVAAICSLGVFVVTFILFRYVSLGSIVAALLLPVFVFILGDSGLTPLHLLAMLIAVVVLLTHRRNLGRLLKREETKMILFRKRG
jgi:acyl phosphate:glycerol-3-phosphate acyltransferase